MKTKLNKLDLEFSLLHSYIHKRILGPFSFGLDGAVFFYKKRRWKIFLPGIHDQLTLILKDGILVAQLNFTIMLKDPLFCSFLLATAT